MKNYGIWLKRQQMDIANRIAVRKLHKQTCRSCGQIKPDVSFIDPWNWGVSNVAYYGKCSECRIKPVSLSAEGIPDL